MGFTGDATELCLSTDILFTISIVAARPFHVGCFHVQIFASKNSAKRQQGPPYQLLDVVSFAKDGNGGTSAPGPWMQMLVGKHNSIQTPQCWLRSTYSTVQYTP